MKEMNEMNRKIDALANKKSGSPFDAMLPILAAKLMGVEAPAADMSIRGPAKLKEDKAAHLEMNKKIDDGLEALSKKGVSGPDMLNLIEVANANPTGFFKLVKKIKDNPELIDQAAKFLNI